ncbi:hypothetical protein ACFXKR_25395 [Streptomyces violascens]|uniref:hypothetical protein n=1 Tax=Streptomyces violascens TaxID=67381 RepID=UPI0036934725
MPHIRVGVGDGRRRDSIQTAADLTFGDYGYLFKELPNWSRLRWDVDHQLFLDGFEHCRTFRNNLMHFSPDQLAPVE